MGFFSSAWKSMTGSQDRRRAREQSDQQAALLQQQMSNQRDQMAAAKKAKDQGLVLAQNSQARDTFALGAAQALSLRSKGLKKPGEPRRSGGRGTNSAGILV